MSTISSGEVVDKWTGTRTCRRSELPAPMLVSIVLGGGGGGVKKTES